MDKKRADTPRNADPNTPRHFTRSDALALLREPFPDRERNLWHDCGGIILIDDGGGECITSFDDATAVFYFLKWYDQQRERQRKADNVWRRRKGFRLIESKGAEGGA
jgi:hypothetical protein